MSNENELSKGGFKKLNILTDDELTNDVIKLLDFDKFLYAEDDESESDIFERQVGMIVANTLISLGVHITNQDRNINIANVLLVKHKLQKERIYNERRVEDGAIADVYEKIVPEHFKVHLSTTTISKNTGLMQHLVDEVKSVPTNFEKKYNYLNYRYNFIFKQRETLEERWNDLLEGASLLWRTKKQVFTLVFDSEEELESFRDLMNKEIQLYHDGEFKGEKERNIKFLLEKDEEDLIFKVNKNIENKNENEESVGNE